MTKETAAEVVTRRTLLQGATVAAGTVGFSVLATPMRAEAATGPVWGDRDRSVGGLTSNPIVGVRTGAHPTYDRLVLDFAGAAAGGCWLGYSEAFWSLGEGRPYLVGGDARLLIAVWGRTEMGLGPGQVISNSDAFAARGFAAFADLVFGGTLADMNWSAFGLGVRARRRFRVFQLGPNTAGNARLVIDVARP